MKYPKISIVTTSFNHGEYLDRTIQSVLSQEYPNLEYIIIDGASTDDSVDIIKKYQKELAYWESSPDNGMYEALNKGFAQSTGEYMAWINSDDMYHPGAFSIIHEIFSRFEEIQWLTGVPSCFDNDDRIIWLGRDRKWSVYNILIGDFRWIQQESTFWKRQLWEKAGSRLSTTYKYAGDFDLWCRFFRHARLYNINSLIGGYRKRGENQAALDNHEQYLSEVREIRTELEKEFEDDQTLKGLRKIIKRLKMLKKTRILNHMALVSRIEEKKKTLFNFPEDIIFDPRLQRFIRS